MMASRRYGTLYIGVTGDLARRAWEHREGVVKGFTATYNCKRLVWWEPHDLITEAITREKQLKEWKRDWKIRLIETDNPDWDDLYGRW
jgi:putative endonuclease